MTKLEFLQKNVFTDLQNLNTGFDADDNFYFSELDFAMVLERIEYFGIGIHAIKPYINEEFGTTKTNEDYKKKATDAKWYKRAYFDLKKATPKMIYNADYKVSAKLLNKNENKTNEAN
ncbi:hypothetical protein [Cellulophaga lytica]|uniref:Uncharacterized protein n=1 Tax=Cellulophaga lytica (strain ATCC 23178 / DSM 7489 / JCM 8516 / NBRC 14961 / NCIMB 1423 / VKM B-1433 / Cy l20) TaxID=867900 RepID=F0RHQ2_CELLC|nr:hypothetical protein [Cellulophaga lytica]ADY28161.1 hypothetical protein Celly_0326 [Cellulophaga lytica DSM 7489]AIM59236.1 hypothetical protein IX49_01330 [Cellulophaga lytica]WQG77655.1 hypothetical protein SR888_01730 [Cellulophaga lytica]